MKVNPIIKNHNHCEMVIIKRLHKGRLHPITGLYCKEHGILVKWLSNSEAIELRNMGIEDLGMLNDEQTIYNKNLIKMK